MIKGDDLRRFWSKTTLRGECLVWTAGRDKDGYGKFATGPHGKQKHWRAHRWIYEQTIGPIGKRLLLHSCDNPACVRVEHLRPGTQKENIAESVAKGRFTQWRYA